MGGIVKLAGVGFDGSESDDWTALKAETLDGLLFTPTYGPDKRPTIWAPEDWGGRIPRGEVDTAVREILTANEVGRMYVDPRGWQTEAEAWALEFGDELVVLWPTYRIVPMHAACERFVTDLQTGAKAIADGLDPRTVAGALFHDGCPITTRHIANARKVAKPGERYILSKPTGAYHQKIDAGVAAVICHEAAADARASGWTGSSPKHEYVYSA